MDSQTNIAPSRGKIFLRLFFTGLICAMGFTIVISVIVERFTYGGPGIGFLLFPIIMFMWLVVTNLLLALVLDFSLGKRVSPSHLGMALVLMNVIGLVLYSGIVLAQYGQKSAAANSQEQKQSQEKYLADYATSISQCDEITDNFYYWQRCLITARTDQTTPSQAELQTICLQQAEHKHFAYQPEAPTATCQNLFK